MSNPIFIDPLASEVIGKQRLGIEYVTDFVVKRLDNEYILTELEKPWDRVFTAGADFTANFTHGLGQVLDFQQWVNTHAEYARTLMPGIATPRGLLVIGRSTQMTEHQKNKLHRFRLNSSGIEILTYDDLLHRAKTPYENLIRKL
jgi:hypothetical protein